VLEEYEFAKKRGANILAEITGYGISGDAFHMTAPDPDGDGARRAMEMALADAGHAPSEVDYINAHGTSTPANDTNETAAIKAVLGDAAYDCVVGSTKSMTGHLLGAAGGVEAVITTLVIGSGRIPPTINFEEADPTCDLEYAHGGPIDRDVDLALSNSFGFGGHNVCLALRKWAD
jgi:3-oxoacyl-[acyl-carrier-protein] synthase II